MALANDAYAANYSTLHLETYNSSSSASWQRWLLTEVSSPASGIAWKASNSSYSYTSASTSLTIAVGNSVTYSTVYYSPTDISQEFTWSKSGDTNAIYLSNGKITARAAGTATVTATHTASGRTLTINITVIPLPNNTYYVTNTTTDRHMQPDDNGTSNIEQHKLSIGNDQKWIIGHFSAYTGYYTIRNESSGLYLTAPNNTTDGASIVQQAYSSSTADRQLWKITQQSNGQYKIQAKARVGSNLYLAVSAGTNANGLKIQQRTASDRNGWLISPISTIHLEAQETNVWCWAASARIASFRFMDSQRSQASAAVFVKDGIKTLAPTQNQITSATETGTSRETKTALSYILSYNNIYNADWVIYEESVLQAMLDESYPVIILRGWYDNNGKRNGGHYTVIYDYHWDLTQNEYLYDIYDPGNGGSSYSRTYESICNGRTDGKDTGIWESIVVYKVGLYNNTVDSPAT